MRVAKTQQDKHLVVAPRPPDCVKVREAALAVRHALERRQRRELDAVIALSLLVEEGGERVFAYRGGARVFLKAREGLRQRGLGGVDAALAEGGLAALHAGAAAKYAGRRRRISSGRGHGAAVPRGAGAAAGATGKRDRAEC